MKELKKGLFNKYDDTISKLTKYINKLILKEADLNS